jgi:hypothetical protein
MAPVCALSPIIEALQPADGGYRLNTTDAWIATFDPPSESGSLEYRHLLARVDVDGLSISGRVVEHRLSILVCTSSWPGAILDLGGQTLLSAYDVAIMASRHLAESLAIHGYGIGQIDLTPASSPAGNWILARIPVSFFTSF